jgi:hypothetical protein
MDNAAPDYLTCFTSGYEAASNQLCDQLLAGSLTVDEFVSLYQGLVPHYQ